MKRGDTVTVTDAWIELTTEEIDAQRAEDRARGRYHDDGGEPILYGPYSKLSLDLTVTVTHMRPQWKSSNRPKGLREGFCANLDRKVLFQER